MIINQWTDADTLFVEDYDAAMAAIEADAKRVDATHVVGDEYAVTLDDEMLAELNAERISALQDMAQEKRDHAKFASGLNNNLCAS